MLQPQYSNAFSVTYNQKLGEVVINFTQEYPIEKETIRDGEGGLQVKTEGARADVCAVALPREIACQLIDFVGKAVNASEES